MRALVLANRGRFETASVLARRALAREPDLSDAHVALGLVTRGMGGEISDALPHALAAAAGRPLRVESLVLVARMQSGLGNVAAAGATWRKAKRIHEGLVPFDLRGTALADFDLPFLSESRFERLVEVSWATARERTHPKDERAPLALAVHHGNNRDLEAARAAARRAIAINPHRARSYEFFARAHEFKQNEHEALVYAYEAVKRDSALSECWRIVAHVEGNEQQYDRALVAVERSLALQPRDALWLWIMKGDLLLQRGDLAGARTALETGISLGGDTVAIAYQKLALVARARKDPAAVVDALEAALRHLRGSPSRWDVAVIHGFRAEALRSITAFPEWPRDEAVRVLESAAR
jgi:tetratricopeptide (TPR) repeat protein